MSALRPGRLGALVAAGALALLVGCTSSDAAGNSARGLVYSDAAAATAAPPEADQAADQAADQEDSSAERPASAEGGTESGGSGDSAPAPELTVTGQDRQVVRTASVALSIEIPATDDNQADRVALTQAVTEATVKVRGLVGSQGYVSSAETSGRVSVLILRVPAAAYQAVFDNLATIGTVTSVTEQTDDVTAQLVDLESRISTMKASVDRVRALLAQATSIADIVSLESELAQREADLESVQRQSAALAGQAALSTVTITLTGEITGKTVIAEEPVEATGFGAGLQDGWDALTAIGGVALTVLGAILPFLPLLAVGVAVVWWLIRRRRQTVTTAAPGGA